MRAGGDSPSEAQLAAALDAIDAIEFQVLAEGFARLREPSRFARLSPVGRTPSLRATNTWGDGRVTFSDGHIDVVEATTRKDPEQHLVEDAETIAEKLSGRVDGFLFVATGPEPSERVIADRRKRLEALGLPEDSIDLVFGQRLVMELAEPRFSTLWPLLGLPVTSTPFQSIELATQIFGDPANPHRFIPSRDDFEQGLVPWLQAHQELLDSLHDTRFALVRGDRGSGKTVLSAQVGLRWRSLGLPVLYLDLASSLSCYERLEEKIDSRSDAGVLFVIDNIHADESRAAAIERHWRSRGDGSALLLAGRPALPSRLGTAGPLSYLPEEQQIEVGPDVIRAVLNLEFGRRSLSTPEVPADALASWPDVFGRDLICLIGAIRNRLPAMRNGDWSLSAADAVEYVKTTYLHESEATVNDQLGTLAVMSQLEIAVPEGLLTRSGIEHARDQGLLEKYPDRLPGQFRYSLPHPALAALLLEALPIDEIGVLVEGATHSPQILGTIAARLRNRGDPVAATTVVRGAIEGLGPRLPGVLALPQVVGLVGEITKSKAVPLASLDGWLAQDPDLLAASVRSGAPFHLAALIQRVAKRMPRTKRALYEICDDPDLAQRYAELSLAGGSQSVKQSLQHWSRLGLNRMARALLDLLESEGGAQKLVDDAFARGPGYVADAVRIGADGVAGIGEHVLLALTGEAAAERLAATIQAQTLAQFAYLLKSTHSTPDIRDALGTLLGREACKEALAAVILQANLADISDFMSAARGFGETEAMAMNVVADPRNRPVVEASAVDSPLRFLPRFLQRVRAVAPDLHEAIGRALSEPEAVDQAIERMLEQPRRLAGLRLFFAYTEVHLPRVFNAFLDRLAEEEMAAPLAATAVRIENLEDLTKLLDELQELVPDAAGRVRSEILSSPHIERLLYLLYRSDNLELIEFTRTVSFSEQVWGSMPLEIWSDRCDRMERGALRQAWELALTLEKAGFPRLAAGLGKAIAGELAKGGPTELRPDLLELCWLLEQADLTSNLRLEAVRTIATGPWLHRKLQWEPVDRIVPFIEACWSLGEASALWFLRSEMIEAPVRIRLSRATEAELAVALTLIGAMSLAGRDASFPQLPVQRHELKQLLANNFSPPFELDSRRSLLLLGAIALLSAHHLPLDLPPGSEGYLRHLFQQDGHPSPFSAELKARLLATGVGLEGA